MSAKTVTGRWVRIKTLAKDPGGIAALELTVQAMEDYAALVALQIVHGDERGWDRYVEAGGRVRRDDEGEPVIWTTTKEPTK